MADYKHDYTQADNQTTDGIGVYVTVQHNKSKDSPIVTVWRTQGIYSFLENNPKIRQISNSELRLYTGSYGSTFAIEVRVND